MKLLRMHREGWHPGFIVLGFQVSYLPWSQGLRAYLEELVGLVARGG